jgi:tetratricopeptide (TPR) repeat protein
MKSVSTIALAAALALGGANVLLTTAAEAQPQQPTALPAPAQPQRTFSLTRAEQTAIQPLHAAVEARNYAAAQAALPAARAAAQSADARYVLAQSLLRWGIDSQNMQLQSDAIEALIASGGAEPAEMPLLLRNQAAIAVSIGNRQRAEAAYTRLLELSPNDSAALVQLAEVKLDLRRPQDAVPLFERALQVAQASGQRPPESWYRRAVRLAYDNRMIPQTLNLSRALVAAYPSPVHWRDALLNYRDLSQFDEPLRIDHYRLMRAAGALAGERDYLEMATLLHQRGFSGEASALLQEGVSARQINASEGGFRELIAATGRAATQGRAALAASQRAATASTQASAALTAADALYGYGRYAEAAELYRAALQRGGADASLLNTRLGASLALAGQRAEAETALRAVTGPRAELAQFWLAWLARRTG